MESFLGILATNFCHSFAEDFGTKTLVILGSIARFVGMAPFSAEQFLHDQRFYPRARCSSPKCFV
jgi:hypothetical protein